MKFKSKLDRVGEEIANNENVGTAAVWETGSVARETCHGELISMNCGASMVVREIPRGHDTNSKLHIKESLRGISWHGKHYDNTWGDYPNLERSKIVTEMTILYIKYSTGNIATISS